MFPRRNVGDHPPGAAQAFHDRCQSTLKLLWWLRVAQSPAKTLLMCSWFWLLLSANLAHLSPYLPPPSSLHLPPGGASLRGSALVRLRVCVCPPFTVSRSRLHVQTARGRQENASGCAGTVECLFLAKKPNSVHLYKAAFLPQRMGSGEDGSPAM